MHAVYFGIQKNYTHTNIEQLAQLANIRILAWQKREVEEDKEQVKKACDHESVNNMVSRRCRERHPSSLFLEPTAMLWEINAMKLPALMDELNFCRA